MANPIFHSQYTAQQIEGLIEHGVPIIQNGTFWRWDIVSQQYVDTGIRADAEQAAEDAEAARDAAIAAKEDAVTAQGAAEIAQGKSEDAAEHAEEVVENKADIDGDYDELTAGTARQLVGSSGASDSAPYTFRKTGGGKSVGNRAELQQIVGGTVAWNQLIGNIPAIVTRGGVTFTNNGDGSITANGTSEGGAYVTNSVLTTTGHKYLLSGCPSGGSSTTYGLYLNRGSGEIEANRPDFGNGVIVNVTTGSPSAGWSFVVSSGVTVSNLKVVPQLFDLTLMFGSAIADYIYGLETATAGAGVAKLKEWGFDLSTYHAANAGTLESVKTSGKTAVGFNQWDEEWENGAIVNGEPVNNPPTIRSKNFCRCIPSTSYFVKTSTDSPVIVCWYDKEKNFTGQYIPARNITVTAPSNAHYFKLGFPTSYGATYNGDTCVNISSSRNGEYEPYEAHTYALDPVELRGILMLDSGNNLFYDGDEYAPDGAVTRRYGVVDLGTLNWSYQSAYPAFLVYSSQITPGRSNSGLMICSAYPVSAVASPNVEALTAAPDKTVLWQGSNSYIYIKDSAYTDAAAFKAAVSGQYLVYELATPIAETAAPYQKLQIVDADGTEAFTDAGVAAGDRDIAIPVGHETFYPADLAAAIERVMVQVPPPPSGNGNYRLTATVTSGGVTYSWEVV